MRRLLGAMGVVLLVTSSASALEFQTFTRATTAPHVPTLVAAISPSLVAGSVHVSVIPNGANFTVIIGAGSWNGVTLASVQAQVDATPADTVAVRVKFDVDNNQGQFACILRAVAVVIMNQLNTLRTSPTTTFSALTEAQVKTAVDNQIDAQGCVSQ